MSFVYRDITGTGTESGQYEVLVNGSQVGIIIRQGSSWLVARPNSNNYESQTFLNKQEAAQHLADLAELSRVEDEINMIYEAQEENEIDRIYVEREGVAHMEWLLSEFGEDVFPDRD